MKFKKKCPIQGCSKLYTNLILSVIPGNFAFRPSNNIGDITYPYSKIDFIVI